MKKLPLILFASLCIILISARVGVTKYHTSTYDPRSGGAAFVLAQDLTGGPLSTGTCGNCHQGGTYNTQVSINVYDSTLNLVSEYIPGATYTIQLNVTVGTGSPFGFGAQMTSLDGANQMAGNFTSVSTSNTQLSPLGQVVYLEHSGTNLTGELMANWKAPSNGVGPINLYGIGLAVNGNGSTFGDEVSAPLTVTLTEGTGIYYSNSVFCQNQTDPIPNQSGTGGGTYSAGAGLTINSTTGQIDLSASTPGTYTVTYTYAGGSTTTNVTIAENYTTSTSATICSFETYDFHGQILDSSDVGLNTVVLPTVDGCDSTVNLTLNVINADNGVTLTSNTLTANQAGLSYQWLDCDNNFAIINGEVNQSYTPTVTGNYAVEVSNGSCVDTSACMNVNVIGLEELQQSEVELIKIIDLMGRETEIRYNTPLIFIYSDGTREKVIFFED